MRRARVMRAALVGCVVLGAAGLGTAALVLRPAAEWAASRAVGRAVTVGRLHLAWRSGVVVEARDVTVANPAWAARPDFLRAGQVRASIDLLALARGEAALLAIQLDAGDLDLEIAADGRRNWHHPPTAEAPAVQSARPAPAPGSPRRVQVMIGPGRATFSDRRRGWTVTGEVAGTAEVSPTSAELHLALSNPSGALKLDGTVDRADPARGSSAALSGHVAAPLDIDLTARVAPTPAGAGVSVTAHAAGASLEARGVFDADTQAFGAVVLEGHGLGTVAETLGVAWAPSELRAAVTRRGDEWAIHDLRLALPQGDILGDLDLTLAARPSVRGHLASPSLTFSTASAAVSPAPPSVAPLVMPPPFAVSPHWPDWLHRADVDLRVAAAAAAWRDVTARDVAAHVVLREGRLAVDQGSALLQGEPIDFSAEVEAGARPPRLAARLRAPRLALAPALRAAGILGGVSGVAAVEAELHAGGMDESAMLASLAGRASFIMGAGEVNTGLLGPLLAAAHLPAVAARVTLRCVVLRADIVDGVARFGSLVVDASQFLVRGDGDVDLGRRTLSLHLRPLLRAGPGLLVPVAVSGAWAAPKVGLDRRDVVGTLAAMTEAGGDPCREAGVATAAPLPRIKPPNAGDLLRSLLR